MINSERAILADREALARAEKGAAAATNPLVKQAHEADARYLRGLIDRSEQQFFLLHDIS